MYVGMHVLELAKNPKILKLTRLNFQLFFGVSDPKKAEFLRPTRPDPSPNFGFRFFRVIDPKNRTFHHILSALAAFMLEYVHTYAIKAAAIKCTTIILAI